MATWLIGFIIFTCVAGLVLSLVFQLAHTVEHTSFPVANEVSGKMEDEWAIHQIKTTANFATRNKLVSWLVGGLNFQIEHHLFPKISHVHYPAISKIIKKACMEYGHCLYRVPESSPGCCISCSLFKTNGKALMLFKKNQEFRKEQRYN